MYAYILVSVIPGNERDIFDHLSDLPNIKDAHILFGEWDIILKVEAESPEQIEKFVIDDVRTMEGIELTSTMIVAK